MDVLRSCHSSTWRFFAGHPEKLTRGHFYFVPQHAPVLPFFHDFYSATWTNGDEQSPLRTGPVQEAARPWRRGDYGMTTPPPRQIGDQSLFEGGLTFPNDVNASELRNGVPLRCWTDNHVPFEDFNTVADTLNCCLRSAYFQIVDLLYSGDSATPANFFLTWLGPETTFTFVPAFDLIPAMGIVVTPQYTLVFVSGTTQYQQLALQALGGLQGPQNFGNVSTTQLWFTLSSYILAAIESAGSDSTKPILLAGHSYGGAGCAVLAIRLAMGNPLRPVRIIAWGMPKPCDQAGIDQLVALEHVFVVNEGDFVPLLPLSRDQTAWFDQLVGANVLQGWSQWQSPPTVLIQSLDGRKRIDVPPSLGFNTLLPIVTDAITFQPVAPIQPHRNRTYIERSCLMCDCPRWPFSDALWALLFPLGCPPPVEALNAGMMIGAQVIDGVPPGILCRCCDAIPVPLQFTVELFTDDYPDFNGIRFLMIAQTFGDPCEWFGNANIGGVPYVLQLGDNSNSHELLINFFDFLGSFDSVSVFSTILSTEMTCAPFGLDATRETSFSGIPNGKHIRFVKVETLETISVGLQIGANGDFSELHAGIMLGAQVLDGVPHIESFDVGILIGAEVV